MSKSTVHQPVVTQTGTAVYIIPDPHKRKTIIAQPVVTVSGDVIIQPPPAP
jgi:hypothetical protein